MSRSLDFGLWLSLLIVGHEEAGHDGGTSIACWEGSMLTTAKLDAIPHSYLKISMKTDAGSLCK